MEEYNSLSRSQRKEKDIQIAGYKKCTKCYKMKPLAQFTSPYGQVFKLCADHRKKVTHNVLDILEQAQIVNIPFKCNICKQTYYFNLKHILKTQEISHTCKKPNIPFAHLV